LYRSLVPSKKRRHSKILGCRTVRSSSTFSVLLPFSYTSTFSFYNIKINVKILFTIKKIIAEARTGKPPSEWFPSSPSIRVSEVAIFKVKFRKIRIKNWVRPRTPYLESSPGGIIGGGDCPQNEGHLVVEIDLNRVQKNF